MADHVQQLDENHFAGSRSNARTLTEEHVPRFAEAFDRLSQGEFVTWQLMPQAMPNPMYHPQQAADQPQWITIFFLYTQIPGPVINTVIMSTTDFQAYGLSDEIIERIVRERIEELLAARSIQLKTMAEGEPPEGALRPGARNGGKIILPGGNEGN